MSATDHILVINPGSTSTKVAIYHFDQGSGVLQELDQRNIPLEPRDAPAVSDIKAQLPMRQEMLVTYLAEQQITPTLIMARGAPLAPLEGGIYGINQAMIEDLVDARFSQHASNLGALIADRLSRLFACSAYVADPVTTDEFEPVARLSGVPEIPRKSRSHALNIKATTRRACEALELNFTDSRWVVCHLGGGISVAAVRDGRIIDVNDALLGMGPFSGERAGALPLAGILKMSFSGKYSQAELEQKFSQNSGLKAYCGSADLRQVEALIDRGDEQAALAYEAMIYQIVKEAAAMSSVLDFRLNGIILTGGMANSERLTSTLREKLAPLSPILVYPGEGELQALAQAGARIIQKVEAVKSYHSPTRG